MSLRKIESTIHPMSTIKKALEVIEATHRRLACVIGDDQKFLGVISDGDIRRSILEGKSLEEPIINLYNRESVVANTKQSDKEIVNVLISNSISHVPIVDGNNFYIKMLSIYELLQEKKRKNSVLIMAGGLGTRLRPLTNTLPKPMLEVNGEPLLEIIIKKFIEQGFVDFIISTNYKSEKITDYFGDGSGFGVSIVYTKEEKRMGTAGPLLLASDKLSDKFIVINGDIVTNIDFKKLADFHNEKKADFTVCTRKYEVKIPYGVVKIDNNKFKGVTEKPSYSYDINTGIYMMNRSVLNYIPIDEFYDMPELIENLKNQKKNIFVFSIREYWSDIGTMNDLLKARS